MSRQNGGIRIYEKAPPAKETTRAWSVDSIELSSPSIGIEVEQGVAIITLGVQIASLHEMHLACKEFSWILCKINPMEDTLVRIQKTSIQI